MAEGHSKNFITLQDLFEDWFYIENKSWSSLSEFVKSNRLESVLTSRNVSDIMLGKAYLPANFSKALAKLVPFKITPEEVQVINRQAYIRNRNAYMVEMSDDAIMEIEQRRRAKSEANPNSLYMRANRHKRVVMLLGITQGIIAHKEQFGETVEQVELSEEAKKKKDKREKRHKYYLKTKKPDFEAQNQVRYETDEERHQAVLNNSRNFRQRRRVAEGKPAIVVARTPEEKQEARKAAVRKYEEKLSFNKKAKKLSDILGNIIAYKEAYGELIERKEQVVKEKRKRRVFATEEEREAAQKEANRKSNASPAHQKWREDNPDKVLEYGRNWRKNNPDAEKEVRNRYKSANRDTINEKSRKAYHKKTQPQRVETLLGVLRGIEIQKETYGEKIEHKGSMTKEEIKKKKLLDYQRKYRKAKKEGR